MGGRAGPYEGGGRDEAGALSGDPDWPALFRKFAEQLHWTPADVASLTFQQWYLLTSAGDGEGGGGGRVKAKSFTDPSFLAAQAEYLRENSPERLLERAERLLARERARHRP